jgi:hypothetical protein
MGVDARNHNGDFALALIAKGTGYFGHGRKSRIGWKELVSNKRAQRYNKANVCKEKNGAATKRLQYWGTAILRSF